jgi:hypothetical protein
MLVSFACGRTWSGSPSHTSSPFPSARCRERLRAAMSEAACVRVGGDRRSSCGGGRPGGWAALLSWLRRAAGGVGARAQAGGADARRRAVAAAAAGVLSGVRDDARAAARVLGAAQARWRGGDRCCAAGQGRGCWASHDRSAARSPAGNGTRLAACIRPPRRDDQPLSAVMDARDRRVAHAGAASGLTARGRRRDARHRGQGVPVAPRDARGAVGAGGRADRRAAPRPPA